MPVETIDRLADELDAAAKAVSADVDRFFARLLSPTGDSREAMIAVDAYFSRADCTELMIAAARWPARGHRGRSTAQLDSEVAR